ncbi:MAG TPA: hypothetical protein ENJ08_01455 [Gammaproteobacteria bacterium]|nr:hypothetical protein [Gammaproteobacteria bacterium]
MKLAYITSSSFSGSTLLSFLLNSNPQIATISEFDVMDEIKNNPDYMCSCGDRIRDCDFFKRLEKEIKNEGVDFKLDDMDLMFYVVNNERINRYLTQKIPFFNSSCLEFIRDFFLRRLPFINKRIAQIFHRNKIFMEKVIELQKGSVFLDANKNPYRLKYLAEDYDTTAIYLYKNGIAGAYSFYKASRKLDENPINFEQACIRWFVEQITINRCLNGIPSIEMISLPYSQLCARPEESIQKICHLLGIEHTSLEDFQKVEHHIIGNVMRTASIGGIRESTDWKDNLTEGDYTTYRKIYKKYIGRLSSVNREIARNIWFEE